MVVLVLIVEIAVPLIANVSLLNLVVTRELVLQEMSSTELNK